ncbi:MAG: zinc ribbon domain-containing protein [Anaerolineae bacterium]
MTLPPNLNVYVSAALFVLGAYIFALYAGLVIWTFRDIHARSRDVLGQIMATLLVAVFILPGLLIYVLVRPRTTLADTYERDLAEEAMLKDLEQKRACPKCQRRVEADFVICPHCKEQLKLRCVLCERLVNPEWDICPYCGQIADGSRQEESPVSPEAPSS